MRNRFWLAVLATITLPGCEVGPASSGAPARVEAPADSAAGEVDFDLAGPSGVALVVPVRINGAGPFPFVLDTGATLTCLDQALADSLALPAARGAVGFGAGVGGQGRVAIVTVDSLSLGAASAYDLSACTIDLAGIQDVGVDARGLVGLNFLRSFRVTLDFERSVVRLEAP
jgi:predicted aspartyl protease